MPADKVLEFDDMLASVEIYKGIEFVRFSTLPKEQSELLNSSAFKRKTIKILHDTGLLTDCLPYSLYLEWYHKYFFLNSAR